MPLENLKALRNDMKANEKGVIVFRFTYKQIAYFIAVCLLTKEDYKKKEAEYALVRLCFMKADNINDFLDCYANSMKIITGLTDLRKFLGVEYQEDGIAWLNNFLKYLGKNMPTVIPDYSESDQGAIINTICRHEKHDPNRIYRYYMFRNGKENGKQKYRTEYNGQLASIRFPVLYPKFKNDKIISFAFTEDIEAEKTEEEILRNFEENERRNSRKCAFK